MIPAWVDPYIGIPYHAYDCWALVRRVLSEHWNIELPVWTISDHGVKRDEILLADIAWEEIPPHEGKAGDVVAVTRGLWVAHVGLVISPGWMLHTLKEHNSARERYDGFVYRSRVAGLYRHPALQSARTPA